MNRALHNKLSSLTKRRSFLKATFCAGIVGVSPVSSVFSSRYDEEGENNSKKAFHNPIFPGANADPEVLLSRKTGRA